MSEIPRWLRFSLRAGLVGVIAVGVAGTILLARGAATPYRGKPIFSGIPGQYRAEKNQEIVIPFAMPDPADLPITFEITATLEGDPSGAWGLRIGSAAAEGNPPFTIWINGSGYFALPNAEADHVEFIHLRPAPESSKLSLMLEPISGGQRAAILRLNDEIAWQGVISGQGAALVIAGGKSASSAITFQRADVYSREGSK